MRRIATCLATLALLALPATALAQSAGDEQYSDPFGKVENGNDNGGGGGGNATEAPVPDTSTPAAPAPAETSVESTGTAATDATGAQLPLLASRCCCSRERGRCGAFRRRTATPALTRYQRRAAPIAAPSARPRSLASASRRRRRERGARRSRSCGERRSLPRTRATARPAARLLQVLHGEASPGAHVAALGAARASPASATGRAAAVFAVRATTPPSLSSRWLSASSAAGQVRHAGAEPLVPATTTAPRRAAHAEEDAEPDPAGDRPAAGAPVGALDREDRDR